MYSPAPIVLFEQVEFSPAEMCFVQYLPVMMPGRWDVRIPQNLAWAGGFVTAALTELLKRDLLPFNSYAYLTAKHLWVTPDNIGNRPGWHIDGYLSDDLNIIWSDKYPTEVCVQDFNLTPDHTKSMIEMEQQVKEENIRTYGEGSMLLLTPEIVHRPPAIKESGMRTFLKLSISKDQYNLKGNAHNYLFDYEWDMCERQVGRNTPAVHCLQEELR